MNKILLIQACVRESSRTLRLARHLLARLDGAVTEVGLERAALRPLCGTVSSRLRKYGFLCETVCLSIRDIKLNTITRQKKLPRALASVWPLLRHV